MGSSRWYRAGVLLLAVWLLADAASCAYCDPQPRGTAAGVTIVNGSHDQQRDPTDSTDHPCLCCSHGAEIVTLDVRVAEEPTTSVPLPLLGLADVAPRHVSPPPRV